MQILGREVEDEVGHSERRVSADVLETDEPAGPSERSAAGQDETKVHGRILLAARLPVKAADVTLAS